MRGRISPKVMAKMIRNAVAPFAAVLVGRAADALGPIETNSTKPAAALSRKSKANFVVTKVVEMENGGWGVLPVAEYRKRGLATVSSCFGEPSYVPLDLSC
jgi:hypothetical protein